MKPSESFIVAEKSPWKFRFRHRKFYFGCYLYPFLLIIWDDLNDSSEVILLFIVRIIHVLTVMTMIDISLYLLVCKLR